MPDLLAKLRSSRLTGAMLSAVGLAGALWGVVESTRGILRSMRPASKPQAPQ